MSGSKKADWQEINRFMKNECNEILSYGFNPYDFAVSAWGNNTNNPNLQMNIPDLLRKTKSLALSIAGEYAVPLEQNGKTYTEKCELSRDIDLFLAKAKPIVDKNQQRFTLDPLDLQNRWLKTIKIEREIEIFEKIEKLVTAPPIVSSRIEQNKVFDAATYICESLKTYEEQHFQEIESLSTVKDSLDQCRVDMVNHVMNSLFDELFIKTPIKGISFYKKTPEQQIVLAPVIVSKIDQYAPILITLDIQNEFISLLKEQLRDRLAKVMSETADSLKVKKLRQFTQAKDGFEELLDIASSYNLSHPLVAFLDQLLSKMWVLLVRSTRLDDMISIEKDGRVTSSLAFQAIEELIREIVTTFTSSQGSKDSVNDERLEFKFVSGDTIPMNGTASSLRTELGIKPCAANSLHIFPMVTDFFAQVQEKYGYQHKELPIFKTLEFAVNIIFNDQLKAITTGIDVTRPVKSEIHTVPVLISTPTIIENMEKFIAIASRFTYLQNNVIDKCIAFLSAFNKKGSDEIGKIKGDEMEMNEIKSSKLLTDDLVNKYMQQIITQELVINGRVNNYEANIKQLADMEEKAEESLMSGSSILSVENTVRVKYHLPQVSAIAESLTVVKQHLLKLTKQYKLNQQCLDKIDKLVHNFNFTIIKAMVFVRLEIRCRTYADIVQSLLGGRYSGKQQSNKPDQYVNDFISTFTNSTETLKPCLVETRYSFVFIGIARLVYDIHIRFIPRIREIDDKGAVQLTTNLSALNQLLSTTEYPETLIYKKAQIFVSNITYTTDRILLQIQQYKDLFTYDELEPVFNMEQKRNEKQEENLAKLRHLFKN